ncbi:prolyl oligopeptidase family serine peptidase [Geitlerinema sp. PCC 9228]|uniref:prolyl oligopeptidase family serine peptidase n=1 Tax=Geitlerinema sp. PCC 9228 TaxID=111611 RepID=UPI0008F9D1F0|nr:prolyl oligopeptidase family serine peptidase [Geitlerinema sp. PCC 9228]
MLQYPQTKTVDHIDTYHRTQVADPYRWLEDLDSEETKAWIEAQNRVTFAYLEEIPQRQQIQDRLTQLWNYEKYSTPWRRGRRYFYFKNDGLQNHSVLYTLRSLDGEPQVLLDPNTFSEDGTVALSGIAISDDGGWIAYGTSAGGSDWQQWKIRNIETGEDLAETLNWIKFSHVSWTKDNQGFYYSRYDEPQPSQQLSSLNYYQKLYYHHLYTPQSEDVLVYQRPDQKEWGFSGRVTEDGRYLIISVWKGTDPKNLVFYQDLTQPHAPVVELISEFEASYRLIGNDGSRFWFFTDCNAPRGKAIAIDITTGEREEAIPEREEILEDVTLLNHQLVAAYLKNAYSQIEIFQLDGTFVRNVELPGIGSVGGFDGKPSDRETFYSFTSFIHPPTIYRYDMVTGESTLYRQPQVDFDSQQYRTEQVFYTSKDGTQVSMFVTYKKSLLPNGENPTYLYGYGGFNISLTPSFSVTQAIWLEMGGILAIPNLRGGGEYGEDWHQAGTKHQKQNVFDDFIAAAEWLQENQWTSREKLAIGGGSNGGLLVGACMTQRPDLFAAAVPAVGVMDMLRFHKFTIGWAWKSDYGDPDNPEDFPALYAYSPLHNLQPGTRYPSTLITTADHDDRVVPAHSFKFAAALQAAHQGENPVLIRIETKAGHGAGKPTSKRIEEASDRLAFLVRTLEMVV